ncbi:hypothetical protein QWY93_05265 [Echinicola jeungdonensis]|uniref:Anti-sigma factor n=1 Tax=Echinicola jeungdonensis TaxID=709343 RepID=A0ABV5J5I7_9BACT|nr:hypothetical protein [Echinicola jeungdonensis]MDN3668734.1 hypothetical protein [Echinicola jeungdonensis]
MEEQLNKLLEKYYEGQSSLQEEKLIRQLLKDTEGFKEEKQFFLGLEALGMKEPVPQIPPKTGFQWRNWQKVAAIALVCLGVGWLLEEQQQEKEELAYHQVMDALSLIRQNMQKGTGHLNAMDNIKHLDKANEWLNIDEIKEEK